MASALTAEPSCRSPHSSVDQNSSTRGKQVCIYNSIWLMEVYSFCPSVNVDQKSAALIISPVGETHSSRSWEELCRETQESRRQSPWCSGVHSSWEFKWNKEESCWNTQSKKCELTQCKLWALALSKCGQSVSCPWQPRETFLSIFSYCRKYRRSFLCLCKLYSQLIGESWLAPI